MITKFKKPVAASGTTIENEPIIKSDGASSNVMQWLSNDESSNITISEDASNNLDLLVSGDTTIGSSLLIRGDNTSSDPGMPYIRSNGSYLVINSDPDNAMYLQNDGSGDLSLCQGGGSVGVGVAAKAWTVFTALQIGSAGAVCGRASNQTDLATNWYYDGTHKRINAGYAQRYVQSTTGTHDFYTAATSTANSVITWGTAALTIDSTGLATFANGIAFSGQTDTSATGAAATGTTLDHYEEGTWTPVAKDGYGGTTLTTSLALGTYVRVGKIVYCTYRITRNDAASLTNSVYFYGLPFTVQNNVTTKNIGVGSSWLPGDDVAGVNYALENTDVFLVQKNDASGYITTNLLTDGSEWYGALTYEADA